MGRLPQRAGLPGLKGGSVPIRRNPNPNPNPNFGESGRHLNGGGAAAAVPPAYRSYSHVEAMYYI